MRIAGVLFLLLAVVLGALAGFFVSQGNVRGAEICGGTAFIAFIVAMVLFVVKRKKRVPRPLVAVAPVAVAPAAVAR